MGYRKECLSGRRQRMIRGIKTVSCVTVCLSCAQHCRTCGVRAKASTPGRPSYTITLRKTEKERDCKREREV